MAYFGIFRSSAILFHLMSSMVAKRVPLRPILRGGNSQQSLGTRSGERGGWVKTRTAAQQAICGSVRYRDAETAQLSLPRDPPLPPNCIARPLENLHIKMIINILARWYKIMAHPAVDVKEFLEMLTASHIIYINKLRGP
jgi:hypothetical protein